MLVIVFSHCRSCQTCWPRTITGLSDAHSCSVRLWPNLAGQGGVCRTESSLSELCRRPFSASARSRTRGRGRSSRLPAFRILQGSRALPDGAGTTRHQHGNGQSPVCAASSALPSPRKKTNRAFQTPKGGARRRRLLWAFLCRQSRHPLGFAYDL